MFHFIVPPILKVADRKSSNPSWNREEVKPTFILTLHDCSGPPINIASSSQDGSAKTFDGRRGKVDPRCNRVSRAQE